MEAWKPSPREELAALLKSKGIDMRAFAATKGIDKSTPDEVIKGLIDELKELG